MEAAEAVRSAVTALNAGDIDGYLAFFDPASPRWVIGLDEPFSLDFVASTLRDMHQAFEPLELQEESLFGDARFVCARWCLAGRQVGAFMGIASGGREIAYRTCEVYEIEDGRVIQSWVYGDPSALFVQLAGQPGGRS